MAGCGGCPQHCPRASTAGWTALGIGMTALGLGSVKAPLAAGIGVSLSFLTPVFWVLVTLAGVAALVGLGRLAYDLITLPGERTWTQRVDDLKARGQARRHRREAARLALAPRSPFAVTSGGEVLDAGPLALTQAPPVIAESGWTTYEPHATRAGWTAQRRRD